MESTSQEQEEEQETRTVSARSSPTGKNFLGENVVDRATPAEKALITSLVSDSETGILYIPPVPHEVSLFFSKKFHSTSDNHQLSSRLVCVHIYLQTGFNTTPIATEYRRVC